MANTTATAGIFTAHWPRVELTAVLGTLLLGVVGFVGVFPLLLTLVQSFQLAEPGQPVRWSLEGWEALFAQQGLQQSAWNTVSLSAVRQLTSLPLAVLLAWLIARTDLPGRNWIEVCFWVSFFLPSLTVTLSWILMLDPQHGLLNQVITGLGLPAFNIYSFWGIVLAHTMAHGISLKVMLLTPAFRNMNAALEEASRIGGASALGTLWRIVVPIMLPTVLAVELLSITRALESFEIEQVLGAPVRLYVLTTTMYDLMSQPVPVVHTASALGVAMFAGMLLLIAGQRWLVGGRRYTTVTGQTQTQVLALGRWRWPAFIGTFSVVVLVVAVPVVLTFMGTFMKLFGFFIEDPWTLEHWQAALRDRLLLRSTQNTLVLAFGTAIGGVVLHSLVAYLIVRTRFWGRGALDFVSWLPFTVPGILLSLALLTMFLQPYFRPIYGSMFMLILAGLISGMPLAVQICKANLLQLGAELEEASEITGANWFQTYTKVVLPLIAPALVTIGLILFIGAARNVATVALLSNSATRPLSILQLDYITDGRLEVASVVGCMVLVLTVGVALVARFFGFRLRAG